MQTATALEAVKEPEAGTSLSGASEFALSSMLTQHRYRLCGGLRSTHPKPLSFLWQVAVTPGVQQATSGTEQRSLCVQLYNI